MSSLPLDFTNMGNLIVILSVILLVTSELMSPSYGNWGITIRRERLRKVAIFMSAISMIIVMIKIYVVIVTM